MQTIFFMESIRLTFSVFAVFFVAIVLGNYARLIAHLLQIRYDWIFELCLVIGQMLFQYPFISNKPFEQQMSYFYHLLFVSFLGAVMLLPILILNSYVQMSDTINVLYFFGVVGIMLFEHMRRVKKLALPAYLSFTWILYRCLILAWLTIMQ